MTTHSEKKLVGQSRVALLILMLFAASGLCQAVELTPFTGYGIGGDFAEAQSGAELELSDNSLYAFAVDFSFEDEPDAQFEVYLSRQETRLVSDNLSAANSAFNVDVDYYHLGGMIQGSGEHVKPFVVGTLGVTYLDPKSSAHESVFRPSLGIGGGVKLFPTEKIGLRFEARAMMTFANSSGAFISNSNGTSVYIVSDVLYQFQFNAGLIIRL